MGLFSFLKGKKSAAKMPLPPTPAFPSSQPSQEAPKSQPMQTEQPSFSQQNLPQQEAKEISQESWAVYNVDSDKEEFPSLGQSSQPKQESPQASGTRQIDDFGIPIKEDLELPEISMPKFKFPAADEKQEIKNAIMEAEEKEEKPVARAQAEPISPRQMPRKEARKKMHRQFEKLPAIGEPAKAEEFPEEIDEPVVLRELPRASKGAVFISAERLNHVKKGLNAMKDNAKNMEDMILNINEIKNKQDADLDEWHQSIEAVQRKLVFIDRTLFEKR